MERLIDGLLFLGAVFAGGALFVVGRRTLAVQAETRWARRFVFYISAVLVFLTGCVKQEPQPTPVYGVIPEPTPEVIPEAAVVTDWTPYLTSWQQLHAGHQQDEASRSTLAATADPFIKQLESRSGPVAAYAKFHLAREQSELRDPTQVTADVLGRFFTSISLHRDALAAVTDAPDLSLAELFKATAEDNFIRVADVPVADRLAAGGLTRDQYKAQVSDLLDAIYAYVRRSGPAVTKPKPTDPPRPQLRYGIRPRPVEAKEPGVQLRAAPRSTRAMPAVEGALVPSLPKVEFEPVSMRRAVGVWTELQPGMGLCVGCLYDNPGPDEAVLGLDGDRELVLPPDSLLTGWELDAKGLTDNF